jgi:hypothetical protein
MGWPGHKPGLCGEKTAINRLSHGSARHHGWTVQQSWLHMIWRLSNAEKNGTILLFTRLIDMIVSQFQQTIVDLKIRHNLLIYKWRLSLDIETTFQSKHAKFIVIISAQEIFPASPTTSLSWTVDISSSLGCIMKACFGIFVSAFCPRWYNHRVLNSFILNSIEYTANYIPFPAFLILFILVQLSTDLKFFYFFGFSLVFSFFYTTHSSL